jgi:hypothetical protein
VQGELWKSSLSLCVLLPSSLFLFLPDTSSVLRIESAFPRAAMHQRHGLAQGSVRSRISHAAPV